MVNKTTVKKEKSLSYQIAGSSMLKAYTINSGYGWGQIELLSEVDGQRYRIATSELLKLIQKERFQAIKKVKYYHLTLIK